VLSCDAGKKRISLSLKRAPVEKSM